LLVSQGFDCFSELIPLGIASKSPEVQNAAFEAAVMAFRASPGNETILINRIAQKPYDLQWTGALELLCQLSPQTTETAESLCEVLGMNRKRGHNKIVEMVTDSLKQYSNRLLQPHLLALFQSGKSLCIVRALDLCFKMDQRPDSVIAQEIRTIIAGDPHSKTYDRAKLVALTHGLGD
jgi:hypothetical protein